MDSRKEKDYSQTVDRAVKILQCFVDREELGISELAKELGLGKSSVFRMVAALERNGLMMQNPDTGKYRLGVGFLLLGSLVQERNELSRALNPIMQDIAEHFQATTHLAVLTGKDVTIINKISAGPIVYMDSRIGGTLHAYCSATGKCILAFSDEQTLSGILDGMEMEAQTPHTITDSKKLLLELQEIRNKGFSVDDEEAAEGLFCIAIPLITSNGQLLAALSVSGQKTQLEPRQNEVVKYMKAQTARYF